MRTSKASLFLFIVFYNFLSLRLFVFPYFYDTYGINGNMYIGIILTIVSILFMIIPKKVFNYNIFNLYIKSKFKYFYNMIIFLRIILFIIILSYIIHEMFYKNIMPIFLIIGLLIPIIILSKLKPYEVIEIYTFFGILSLLFYSIYISNFTNVDVFMLFRNFEFKPNLFMIILFSLIIFFDNLLLILSDNVSLTKNNMLLSLGICGMIFSFEYILFSLTAGDILYKGKLFSGLMVFSISPISRFNGTFDFVYIFILTTSSIFKNAYMLSLTSYTNNSKNIYYSAICIISILCFACYFLFFNYINKLIFTMMIVLMLSGIFSIWLMWRYRNA